MLHEGYEYGVYGISDEISAGVSLVESYPKEMERELGKRKDISRKAGHDWSL